MTWWLIEFEDRDRDRFLTTDEAKARKFYADSKLAWNCTLFAEVESSPSRGPAKEAVIAPTPDRNEYVSDLIADLQDDEFLREYILACVKDSPEALESCIWVVTRARPVTAPTPETREQMADRLVRESGKIFHSSDCSTSVAPAEEPGPCDCDCGQPGPITAAQPAASFSDRPLTEIVAEMRNSRGFKSHPLGYADSVELWKVQEWADELEAAQPDLRALIAKLREALVWAMSQGNDVIEDGAGNWSCVHCNAGGQGASFTHRPDCPLLKVYAAMKSAIGAAPGKEKENLR